MEFTNDEYNQIMESKEFKEWEDSIKRLIDYIVAVMGEDIGEDEKDVISDEIFNNLFICSLNLQDGLKKWNEYIS